MIAAESPPTVARRTLATDLEAHRLEHRTRRMAFVIDALKQRRESYKGRGAVPRPLNDAITEFSHQLRSDRRRLGKLRDTNHEETP